MLQKPQPRKEKESSLRWDEDFLAAGKADFGGNAWADQNARCDLALIHALVILRPWTE
jgi:hypothetical protein